MIRNFLGLTHQEIIKEYHLPYFSVLINKEDILY